MRVSFVRVDDADAAITPIELSPDMEIVNVKALLEAETGLSVETMVLKYEGLLMDDDQRTLADYGIVEDGCIMLSSANDVPHDAAQASGIGSSAGVVASGAGASSAALASSAPAPGGGTLLPSIDWSSISVGPTPAQPRTQGAPSHAQAPSDPEDPMVMRERLLADPVQAQLLSENNPPLYQALVSGDPQRWMDAVTEYRRAVAEHNMQRIRLLAADPFDADAQQQIAENIRMENVEANMRTAMEHNPEAFGQVVMLYVDCKLNGHGVKAFVDSGAQMTIVSQACAERCNIMRLVDRRFAGIARGVGEQKIIGRVHLGQIQIGDDYLQASFSVLEDQKMDLLIGLDMLKRHQCTIDLRKNVLHIGTTGSETPFLPEKDLPDYARLSAEQQQALSPRQPVPPSDPAQEIADRELAEAMAESSQLQQQRQHPERHEESGLEHPPRSPLEPTAASAHPPSSSPAVLDMSNAAAGTDTPAFPETAIRPLLSCGFSREASIAALQEANGDSNLALMALFAKSLNSVGQ